jgi:hypothetical protein
MEIMAEKFPGAFAGYKLEVYFDLYDEYTMISFCIIYFKKNWCRT